MARRRKTSAAEDIMELVAMLPWWAGVLFALLSYFVLHRVASKQLVAAAPPGQVGAMVTHAIWINLAGIGQYILPLLCFAGAGMSVWRRRARKALVLEVAHAQAADALDGISWREFEMLVGEAFKLQGYRIVETGGGGPDGGIDLVLTNTSGEKSLVQCKQWRAMKVGVDVVRELYGVMAARGATGGFVVTSGRFTADAVAFSKGRNLTLVDGAKLHGLLRQARGGLGGSPPNLSAIHESAASTATHAIGCPLCSKPMVRRTAKRGTRAGGEFWGCTTYPACRGTRPIP